MLPVYLVGTVVAEPFYMLYDKYDLSYRFYDFATMFVLVLTPVIGTLFGWLVGRFITALISKRSNINI